MKRESSSERAAWTAFVEGKEAAPANKYGNRRAFFNGKWYASEKEAKYAATFQMLAERGLIRDYSEQKRIVLVPGQKPLRPVVYVADFVYTDDRGLHVVDAKGMKTAMYRLKKRMAALILGITIEEV